MIDFLKMDKQTYLFDKRHINPRFEKEIVDLDTDKFYQDLNQEQKDYFIETLKYNTPNSYSQPHYVWHGNIQNCPTCKKMRVTSCSTCGCGNCFTCGYRYSCNPPLVY